MSATSTKVEIDPEELIEKFNHLHAKFEGDLAQIVEHLILENHVLNLDQSNGYRRGWKLEFSGYPRFLETADANTGPAEELSTD